jgi:hypothetical protein
MRSSRRRYDDVDNEREQRPRQHSRPQTARRRSRNIQPSAFRTTTTDGFTQSPMRHMHASGRSVAKQRPQSATRRRPPASSLKNVASRNNTDNSTDAIFYGDGEGRRPRSRASRTRLRVQQQRPSSSSTSSSSSFKIEPYDLHIDTDAARRQRRRRGARLAAGGNINGVGNSSFSDYTRLSTLVPESFLMDQRYGDFIAMQQRAVRRRVFLCVCVCVCMFVYIFVCVSLCVVLSFIVMQQRAVRRRE